MQHPSISRDLPSPPALTLTRPGMPPLRYRQSDGRLRCSSDPAALAGAWTPCPPPLRVVVADGAELTLAIVAPGHDYPEGDDGFAALARHVASLGMPGVILTALDATPTVGDLIDALGSRNSKANVRMAAALRKGDAKGHILETGLADPFPWRHADTHALLFARDWLAASLDGAAWDDVPAVMRRGVASAEDALETIHQDLGSADPDTTDAQGWLDIMAVEDDDEHPSSLGRRVSGLASRWSLLRRATSDALHMRQFKSGDLGREVD